MKARKQAIRRIPFQIGMSKRRTTRTFTLTHLKAMSFLLPPSMGGLSGLINSLQSMPKSLV
jgi:hypothetical protein